MTQFYSRTDTVYGGGEAIFSFSFSYIKKEDIHVFIDDVETSEWEWLNASQIKVTAPLETGVTVSVRRITPIQDKIVTYENMSMILDDDNLNLSQDQLLNATQELYDNSEQFTIDVEKELNAKIQANKDLIDQNKIDTDKQISDNNDAINARQDAFEAKLNEDIKDVADAADKINQLDESIKLCVDSANNAQTSANNATASAEAAKQAAEEAKKYKNKTITVLKNPIDGGYYLEGNENANTIYKYVYQDKTSVALAFDDIITNTGEQIYIFETFDKSRNAIFRRNIISKDKVERINIKVDYKGTVTFEPVQFDSVNKDLSNLSNIGEKHFLGNRNITNCITEIPQDIKLELKDGKPILKAGSKVYIPNGINKFDEYIIPSDVIGEKRNSNNSELWFYDRTENTITPWYDTYSGENSPNEHIFMMWYDTANNKIKKTSNKGANWSTNEISLPICLATSNTSNVTSIDQVFNGFGYIGSTIFALPGVKGLIPNGRNEDGSLKNKEFVSTEIAILPVQSVWGETTYISSSTTRILETVRAEFFEGETKPNSGNYFWLDATNNKTYAYAPSKGNYLSSAVVIKFTHDKGRVTSLSFKQPFRALDYSDTISWDYVIDSKVNSDGSFYRKYKSGWLEQGGIAPTVYFDNATTVTLLKPFKDTKYYANWISQNGAGGTGQGSRSADEKKTTSFRIFNGQDTNMVPSWYACGQGA